MNLNVWLGFQAVIICLIRIASALRENMLTKLKSSFYLKKTYIYIYHAHTQHTYTHMQIDACFNERKESQPTLLGSITISESFAGLQQHM